MSMQIILYLVTTVPKGDNQCYYAFNAIHMQLWLYGQVVIVNSCNHGKTQQKSLSITETLS